MASTSALAISKPSKELTTKLREIKKDGLEIIIISTPRPGTLIDVAIDVFKGKLIDYTERNRILKVEGYSQEYVGGGVRVIPLINNGKVPHKMGYPIEREIPLLSKTAAIYCISFAEKFRPFYWNRTGKLKPSN